jgi:ASC-1-like (ASCH) protein
LVASPVVVIPAVSRVDCVYIERYKEQLGLVKSPFHHLQLDKIIIGDNIIFTLNTMTVKVGNLIMLSYLNLLLCPVPRGY